jgi:hypothetical protein
MATHEQSHLDRALETIGRVTADFPDLPRAEVASSGASD